MSDPVGPVPGQTSTVVAADAPKRPGRAEARALDEAAREFEAIFVRSLLKSSPLAGKGDAYGDMAIDAMAKSVTAGRGLGLGELIRRAVEKADHALKENS
jgi:Rod binding domain-containing protein